MCPHLPWVHQFRNDIRNTACTSVTISHINMHCCYVEESGSDFLPILMPINQLVSMQCRIELVLTWNFCPFIACDGNRLQCGHFVISFSLLVSIVYGIQLHVIVQGGGVLHWLLLLLLVVSGTVGRTSDLRFTSSQVWVLVGQANYSCVLLSPSSIIWYRPRGVIPLAGKVTAGLVESNGSLPLWLVSPVGWLPRNRDQLGVQRS